MKEELKDRIWIKTFEEYVYYLQLTETRDSIKKEMYIKEDEINSDQDYTLIDIVFNSILIKFMISEKLRVEFILHATKNKSVIKIYDLVGKMLN